MESLIKDFSTSKKAPRLNPKYQALVYRKSISDEPRKIHHKLRVIPSYDPLDSEYKKMVYVRYADDWIIGIRGSHQDTVEIMNKIKEYLRSELGLELSTEKTVILSKLMSTHLNLRSLRILSILLLKFAGAL